MGGSLLDFRRAYKDITGQKYNSKSWTALLDLLEKACMVINVLVVKGIEFGLRNNW